MTAPGFLGAALRLPGSLDMRPVATCTAFAVIKVAATRLKTGIADRATQGLSAGGLSSDTPLAFIDS